MAIGKFSGVVFSDSSKVSSSESEYAYSISGTSQDFEMTISISDAAVSFLLPLEKLTDDGINGTIFWGDGSTDALSFGVVASHTYSATGTYKVRVVSSTEVGLDTVYGSNFDNPPTSIDAWGSSFNGMGFRTDLGNVTTVRKYPPVNFTNNFGTRPFGTGGLLIVTSRNTALLIFRPLLPENTIFPLFFVTHLQGLVVKT